jgi:putative flavoprotein involved in K+ transport
VTDATGRLRHRRGVTDIPGLYFLGLSWQHTRGSALLGWVKHDAEFIAARIDAAAAPRTAATGPTTHDDRALTARATSAIEGI